MEEAKIDETALLRDPNNSHEKFTRPHQIPFLYIMIFAVTILIFVGLGGYLGRISSLRSSNDYLSVYPTNLTSKQSTNTAPTIKSSTVWNTCTSTKDSFSIKFPSTFYQSPTDLDCHAFLLKQATIPAQQSIDIMFFDNPNHLPFLQWLRSPALKDMGILEEPASTLIIKDEEIGELQWMAFGDSQIPIGYPPNGNIYWATLYKDKIILIGLMNLEYEEYKSTIESMLSTFKVS